MIKIQISITRKDKTGMAHEVTQSFSGLEGAETWMNDIFTNFMTDELEEEAKKLDNDARWEGERDQAKVEGREIIYEK